MNLEQQKQAALALLDWFESQEIPFPDTVAVMTIAIAGVVKQIARSQGMNPNTGAAVVADMIRRTVRETAE